MIYHHEDIKNAQSKYKIFKISWILPEESVRYPNILIFTLSIFSGVLFVEDLPEQKLFSTDYWSSLKHQYKNSSCGSFIDSSLENLLII